MFLLLFFRRSAISTGLVIVPLGTNALWWTQLPNTTCLSTYYVNLKLPMQEMDPQEPLGSSSSRIGQNRGYLNLVMDSSISLVKCTKQKSNLDKTVLSPCIAGKLIKHNVFLTQNIDFILV